MNHQLGSNWANAPQKKRWVQWKHISKGLTHCKPCLKLDKCWFSWDNVPRVPLHEHCHCTTIPISAETVSHSAQTYSDFRKFVPYLFNTDGQHPHGKEILFASWGYGPEDAQWLQEEINRQGLQKFLSGSYQIQKLNDNGQRIGIKVALPRKNGLGYVFFLTGWLVEPCGKIRLITPYGDS